MSRVAGGVATVAALVSLTGCATCPRHPVACTAAVAIIGTSVALSLRHHGSRQAPVPVTCENDPEAFPNGCSPIG